MHLLKKIVIAGALLASTTQIAVAQEGGVELSEYVENLRQEFIQLASSGGSEQLALYISPIEIEITVAVVNEGKAGIKFYVVDAGGSFSNSVTQKLKFTVSVGDPDEPYLAQRVGPQDWFAYGAYPDAALGRVPVMKGMNGQGG